MISVNIFRYVMSRNVMSNLTKTIKLPKQKKDNKEFQNDSYKMI